MKTLIIGRFYPLANLLLGCLEMGASGSKFPMIHQNGVRFHNRFAFHEDYGLPTIEEEAEALGTSLADKDVLFMCNHGMYLNQNPFNI